MACKLLRGFVVLLVALVASACSDSGTQASPASGSTPAASTEVEAQSDSAIKPGSEVSDEEFGDALIDLVTDRFDAFDAECRAEFDERGVMWDRSQTPDVGYTFPALNGLCVFAEERVVFIEEGADAASAPQDAAAAQVGSGEWQNVFDVPTQRELPARLGGWGYVDSPPFGALSPGELDQPVFADPEPATVPLWEERWISCREGDGGACDDLHTQGVLTTDPLISSSYGEFGTTCGGRTIDTHDTCEQLLGGAGVLERMGRVARNTSDFLFAVNSQLDLRNIPGPGTPAPGTVTELDDLWDRCTAGDAAGCSELLHATELAYQLPKSEYRSFAESCGGRTTLPLSCAIVLAKPDERVTPGAPPPGLSRDYPTAFVDDPDAAWEACDAGDYRACLRLSIEFNAQVIAADTSDERWPYRLFGATCGGVFDRPAFPPSCLSYENWPTIDDVDSLPGPREFS